MNIERWNPFHELDDLTHRLNRMFGRSPQSRGEAKDLIVATDWSPSVDVAETPEEFLVKAELPGVKKDDVKVSVENGVLSLRGERKQEKEEKGKRFHRVERSYGSFMRSFALPDSVDPAKVQAQFSDGVLNVHLPKSPTAKPKGVEIKVS